MTEEVQFQAGDRVTVRAPGGEGKVLVLGTEIAPRRWTTVPPIAMGNGETASFHESALRHATP